LVPFFQRQTQALTIGDVKAAKIAHAINCEIKNVTENFQDSA